MPRPMIRIDQSVAELPRTRSGLRALASRFVISILVRVSRGCNEALEVATSYIAHSMASAQFGSGVNSAEFYRDYIAWRRAFKLLYQGLQVNIDSRAKAVSVDIFGFAMQTVNFREVLGSLKDMPGADFTSATPHVGCPAVRAVGLLAIPHEQKSAVWADDESLALLLEDMCSRKAPGGGAATKALAVVHQNRLVGEAYASGYGPATPIIGYSLAKSLCNAVVGRMVQCGLLSLNEDRLFPEWRKPGDNRANITISHLLQMTSGLKIPETHSGFDAVSKMLFLTKDMGEFAAGAPLLAQPGSVFDYTCGNTILLARLMRERTGIGSGIKGIWDFIDKELFAPLGLQHMWVEYDHAGTPILSTFAYASARDWAGLGILYLNDGCVGSDRLLPKNWVSFSTTPSIEPSYGAGFCLNTPSTAREKGLFSHLSRAVFYMHGHLGQYVLISPETSTVVVRLGVSTAAMRAEDMKILGRIGANFQP